MVDLARQKELAGGRDRQRPHRAMRNGAWLSTIPHCLSIMDISQEELRYNIRLRYGLMPQDIPTTCNGCGKKFLIEHYLSSPKGDLVLAWHADAAKEWGALRAQVLNPSDITYEPKINNRTVQGERTGDGARQEGETDKGSVEIVGEVQGGGINERARNGSAELARSPGQVAVPAESREDVSTQGVWKQGTTVMFDIIIVNLDAGSYLHMTPKKALEKAEKEMKDLYLKDCMECRRSFTPMVYYADGIPRAEAISAQKRLAALLIFNL